MQYHKEASRTDNKIWALASLFFKVLYFAAANIYKQAVKFSMPGEQRQRSRFFIKDTEWSSSSAHCACIAIPEICGKDIGAGSDLIGCVQIILP